MTSTTSFDDYYSNVPKQNDASEEKKSWLKLKIKAKKVENESVTTVSESHEIQESPKEEAKKVETFRPAISFEAAPKVEPIKKFDRPFVAPVQRKPENRGNFTNKPQGKGNFTKPEVRSDAPKKPVNPNYVNPFLKENREDNRNKRPQSNTPRISFEAAPKVHVQTEGVKAKTPGTPATPGTNPGANKLANYAKSHQNAPKRGRNTLPHKKGGDADFARQGKAGLKEKGLPVEEDGKFRRTKKIAANERRERDDSDIKQVLTSKAGQEVAIPSTLSVKEFSEKVGVPLPKIIAELMKNGMMTNLNTKIDFDTCFLIGETFEVKVVREETNEASVDDVIQGNIAELLKNDDNEKRVPRAPIVSIMGHVDHGKTSILDYIRKTSVVDTEAGGITQKIGAYQVERNGNKITFLDTPGHEAFSIMRSRGAKLTDVAVIVIAADEGMKPQTIESINHAKQAGIPIIIAANKMDKPGANLDLIRGQLAEQSLQVEEWGGNVILVPVSAHTGLGIETLLDMIVLSTEMMELKAHPTRPAIGTVIESHLDPKLGPLSTVLINAGTLKKGEYVVCANAYGRIRALRDYRGKNIDEAGPSVPVQVMGLSEVVEGGDILQVVPDAVTAQTKAHEFELAKSKKSIHNFEGASLGMLLSRIKTGSLKQLKVVLKTDSNGSLEAIRHALMKLSTSETQVSIIHAGVGEVNESDVLMAGTSQALLIAFGVAVNIHAKQTLQNSKIEFIDKKVIYHILEKVEAIITGMVDLKHDDVDLGVATVKAIFYSSKDKLIIGLSVDSGKIENRAKIRVVRSERKVGSWEVANLKAGPLDVHEVLEGDECGISFKGDTRIEIGDTLEFYKMVARK